MSWPRLYPIAAVITALFLSAPGPLWGHEIPSNVTVQVLVKPEGQRLRMIVRVPVRAMRDVNFPLDGPYLALGRSDAAAREAARLWLGESLELYENGEQARQAELIAILLSLPSDRSFASYDEAVAHVLGSRLPNTERLAWDAALLDALFEFPIRSDRSRFSIRLDFRRLASRVTTVLRVVLPDGAVRAFEFTGDPGLIRLHPQWHQAALSFVKLGFFHILDGVDHLLFLVCLVVPFRRVRPLVLIVTSFTVAHSITLIASAFGLAPDALWFPPLVETLIAVSILYMALENIVLEWQGGTAERSTSHVASGAASLNRSSSSVKRRWILTFAFGLVHGFGFSFALRESLQFAGSHLLASLLAFNVGVELGQLAVLALALPALHVFFRYVVAERIGAIVLSALVAHTAWHWTVERWRTLREFGWRLIDVDPGSLAGAMRWLIVALVAGGLVWAVRTRKKGHSPFHQTSETKR